MQKELTSSNEIQDIGEKYELEKELGEGTFAKVYLATRRETGEKVALKTIFVRPLEKEEAMREVRVLTSVSDDHIIRFIEEKYDRTNTNLVLAMELGSKSLRDQMKVKTYTE